MARAMVWAVRRGRLIVGLAAIAAVAVGVSVATAQNGDDDYVSGAVLVTNTSATNSNSHKEADVYCPTDLRAIGGGSDIAGATTGGPTTGLTQVAIRRDAPINGPPASDPNAPQPPGPGIAPTTGWRAAGSETISTSASWNVKSYAICADVESPGPTPPPNGSEPATVGPHWGPMARNVIGSAVQELRNGPFVSPPGPGDSPPFGEGSVGIETKDGTEAARFGNEVDFFGDALADLTQVGFHVFQTGENVRLPEPDNPDNLPNITLEVDPTGFDSATEPNFSSLVFVPDGDSLEAGPTPVLTRNRWSSYIDATSDTSGYWYYTNGATATATGCGQNDQCTFTEMKTETATDFPDMQIATVGVAKGRDHAWQGAVDGLRINDEIFDFEIG
jgi:hypothetical protein